MCEKYMLCFSKKSHWLIDENQFIFFRMMNFQGIKRKKFLKNNKNIIRKKIKTTFHTYII